MRVFSLGVMPYSPKECAKMVDKADESIKIIIPAVRTDFFWNGLIMTALKKAVERGVAVKVAHSLSEAGRVGILSVPGVTILKLNKPRKRLVVIVDAKCVAVLEKPKREKIEAGLIAEDVYLLGHGFDADFNEAGGK